MDDLCDKMSVFGVAAELPEVIVDVSGEILAVKHLKNENSEL